jgi:hypothetical protein
LSLDQFCVPASEVPLAPDALAAAMPSTAWEFQRNYETPESIDWERLRRAVQRTMQEHSRLVVEGHLVFHDAELCRLYTYCVFLRPSDSHESARTLMQRRWRRDYAPQAENKQQWQHQQGSDADCHVPSSPLLVAYERFWRELIWPEHLRYGCSYPEGTLVLSANEGTEQLLQVVLKHFSL